MLQGPAHRPKVLLPGVLVLAASVFLILAGRWYVVVAGLVLLAVWLYWERVRPAPPA